MKEFLFRRISKFFAARAARFPQPPANARRRGVALVIVLGFLVILSGLAIAFFSSVSTELKSSRSFASTITTRQLADTAVHLVMGQIREATTVGGAWASQPGMIRVYGATNAPSATATAFYKLYSAKSLLVNAGQIAGGFNPEAAPAPYGGVSSFGGTGDLASDWDNYPAIFTDLNAPVLVTDPYAKPPSSSPVFPILDPRATIPSATSPSTPAVVASYSGSENWGVAEGFAYQAAGTAYAPFSKTVDGAVNDPNAVVPHIDPANNNSPPISGDSARCPMPARWIYVLQDGTLTVPDSGQGPTGQTQAKWSANYATGQVPTAQNPIVGRVAFWSDDETSKVNINTAGGSAMQDSTQPGGFGNSYSPSTYAGSYWDTPRFATTFDIGQTVNTTGALQNGTLVAAGGLAACQPLQNEFQRYPGHPATTSLGSVFSKLLSSEQLYYLTPAISPMDLSSVAAFGPNSSVGGTERVVPGKNPLSLAKTERLYATLDELLFSEAYAKGSPAASRQTNDQYLANPFPGVSLPYTTAGGNVIAAISNPYTLGGASNAGVINPATLNMLNFFLSASSRSPDLNLWGWPRVNIWPVPSKVSDRSVIDASIAYCATVAGQPFIFQRYVPNAGALSPTMDISDGAGTGAGTTSNMLLLSYLRGLLSQGFPGFGQSFVSKYGQANTDGILGEIFDYIRIANLSDTSTLTQYGSQFASAGHVAPSRYDVFNTHTKIGGFGRTATIPEATLVFYCSGVDYARSDQPATMTTPIFTQGPVPANTGGGTPVTYTIQNFYYRAFLLLPTADVMQGYAPLQMPWRSGQTLQVESVSYAIGTNTPFPTPPGAQQIVPQEMLTVEVCPSQDVGGGSGNGMADFAMTVGGSTQSLFFPKYAWNTLLVQPGSCWSGRNFGGFEGVAHTYYNHGGDAASWPNATPWITPQVPGPNATNNLNFYTLQSGAGRPAPAITASMTPGQVQEAMGPYTTTPTSTQNSQSAFNNATFTGWHGVKLPVSQMGGNTNAQNTATFNFSGGSFCVKIFFGQPAFYANYVAGQPCPTLMDHTSAQDIGTTCSLIQTININFPPGNNWPLPTRNYRVDLGGFVAEPTSVPGALPLVNGQGSQVFDCGARMESAQNLLDFPDPNLPYLRNPNINLPGRINWAMLSSGGPSTYKTFQSTDSNQRPHSSNYWLSPSPPLQATGEIFHGTIPTAQQNQNNRYLSIIQPGDTVRSVYFGTWNAAAKANVDGDLRVLALHNVVHAAPSYQNGTQINFLPHPDYNTNKHWAHSLRFGDGTSFGATPPYQIGSGNSSSPGTINTLNWDLYLGTVPPGAPGSQSPTAHASFQEFTAFSPHIATAGANTYPSYNTSPVFPMSQANGTTISNATRGVGRQDAAGIISGAYTLNSPGDFDTGIGTFGDGPFGGKQDEGNIIFSYFDTTSQKQIFPIPYANTYQYEPPGTQFFSPSRQMPSPGLFGSLLSHPADLLPGDQGYTTAPHNWETLSFCPNTCGPMHPGNTILPKDHLLLDLFTVSFTEPYLISEPLSTAGRVNLNYQLAPYSHILRSTALRAALASVRVTAVWDKLLPSYKYGPGPAPTPNPNSVPLLDNNTADNPRFALDRDETLKAFDSYFTHFGNSPNTGFFKSASQICERFLYPLIPTVALSPSHGYQGSAGSAQPNFVAPTYDPAGALYDSSSSTSGESQIYKFWYDTSQSTVNGFAGGNGRFLTGDNCREKPYSDLYSRVTTKSNTYTVHMRVQTLRQVQPPNPPAGSNPYATWQEGKDQVLGEYRGSATIERYIDPNDPQVTNAIAALQNAAKNYTLPSYSLEPYYRFRVVSTKKFSP